MTNGNHTKNLPLKAQSFQHFYENILLDLKFKIAD